MSVVQLPQKDNTRSETLDITGVAQPKARESYQRLRRAVATGQYAREIGETVAENGDRSTSNRVAVVGISDALDVARADHLEDRRKRF